MTDRTLHGNCEACPACELRREREVQGQVNEYGPITDHRHIFVACNVCGGHGLMAIPDADIVEMAAAEARLNYWPAREAEWAVQMGNVVEIATARKRRAGR